MDVSFSNLDMGRLDLLEARLQIGAVPAAFGVLPGQG